MSYITTNDLINFTKKFIDEDDEETLALMQSYCTSGMEAVQKYLGYDPEKKTYTSVLNGDNGSILALEAQPITTISAYSVDNDNRSVDELKIVNKNQNYIRKRDCSCFASTVEYSVTYTAGYESVPQLIKLTALQIASLFMESSGGNLAVSSTSFGDSGTRVFNNFTMDRFLKQIEEYKIGLK